ncbi:MAG TPA: hypothetical protein VEJ84_10455 [Acidimicrobiales bacterium]|nr:hypothetical protein [Acidimicrobiales bacterium]
MPDEILPSLFWLKRGTSPEVAVEAAIFVVVVGTILGLPAASSMRRRARLKNAPTGSRQTVTARVANADTTIQRWGKLGYDLEERSDYAGRAVRMGVPETRATLTFIKR